MSRQKTKRRKPKPVNIRAVVLERIAADSHPVNLQAASQECRDPSCRKVATGLDGFCSHCAKQRQRDGRWETRKIDGV